MRYRVVGTFSPEGRWQGVGLLCEGKNHRLVFITMRDHGRLLEGDLDSVHPEDHPLLDGMLLTEIRELDRTVADLCSERFVSLLKQGPGPLRRRKARRRPPIDIRHYEE